MRPPHLQPVGLAPAGRTPSLRYTNAAAPAVAVAALRLWIVVGFDPTQVGQETYESGSWRALSSIERMVQQAGGQTFTTNLTVHPDALAEIARATERGINAVVVVSGRDPLPRHLEQWLMARAMTDEADRLPVVMVAWCREDWPFDQVRCADDLGIRDSVAHLAARGHRHIAYLAPARTQLTRIARWLEPRVAYFERAIELAGPAVQGRVIRTATAPLLPEEGDDAEMWTALCRPAVCEFLDGNCHRDITAIVAANDPMARVFMEESGATEISLVGFDDSSWGSSHGLTSVHVPVDAMVARALEVALDRLVRPATAERIEIVVRPTLVVRETSSALRPIEHQ